MKTITAYIVFAICLFGEGQLISVADAERILGQPARMTQNSEENKNGVQRVNTNYIGLADTSVHLYSLSARYSGSTTAHKAYSALVASNEVMQGLEKMTDLGDEAFPHTDKLHFYLIIFRKGDKIITLKINRLSARTSIAELHELAGKIDHAL